MTPELERLRAQWDDLADVLEEVELELVDDPNWPLPSDSSYLTEADRENADIMANVKAIEETNAHIAWFGRDQEGYVGHWRGSDDGMSLEEAPVVRLDTEGQYRLEGATVGDYLAVAGYGDFDAKRAALIAAGFEVRESEIAVLKACREFEDPAAYHGKLYEQYRAEG